MEISKKSFLLLLLDYLSGAIAWALFYFFRKVYIEKVSVEIDEMFYLGALFIPFFWISLYYLQGTYFDIKRLFRMKILNLTFIASVIGTIILFFVFLLDDAITIYNLYYQSLLALFVIHFLVTFIPRIIFTSILVKNVHAGKIGFNTIIIGGSEKAVGIYSEIKMLHKGIGANFIGFVKINGSDTQLENELTLLGHVDNLERLLEEHQVESIIIAIESSDHQRLNQFVSRIHGKGIKIHLLPDMFDITSGSVKMNNIFGVLLVELNLEAMPFWQMKVKRLLDILISVVAIILLIPVYLILAVFVKSSSKGPIFFTQERVGLNGKPFNIIKFRTMYVDAELQGPQLSSTHDPRITKSGKIMRKMRLDEFPQFFNVVKGDMSLVGPRPERQHYISLIVEREPQFTQLNSVRPGITSWGQVKYGYAENVDQMVQRMKYDLLYLKNMSLALDFKIMLYTILIVLKAKGK
ncbi:MAG: sugar transferase [Crocinitomicaceae bacterium]|nr:sugar transferase [Crocinitomicaceae bacterium]